MDGGSIKKETSKLKDKVMELDQSSKKEKGYEKKRVKTA